MYKQPVIAMKELSVMTEQLTDYLIGKHLFKTISVPATRGERLVKMTLGGMIERIALLEKAAPEGYEEVITSAKKALAEKRNSYTKPFFEKLGREAKSYTDSWTWFLQNCWEKNSRCHSDYAAEVNIRLRLEYLLEYGGRHQELADSRNRVRTLDEQLRERWEKADSPIIGTEKDYPKAQYWWLYGHPRP